MVKRYTQTWAEPERRRSRMGKERRRRDRLLLFIAHGVTAPRNHRIARVRFAMVMRERVSRPHAATAQSGDITMSADWLLGTVCTPGRVALPRATEDVCRPEGTETAAV